MNRSATHLEIDDEWGLPKEFVRRLQQIVPAESIESTLRSFAGLDKFAWRVNSLKSSPEAAVDKLRQNGVAVEAVPWSQVAFVSPAAEKSRITESNLAIDGQVYVQALSSQLAALTLAPAAEEEVLDLAAAPGGKTLQMAAMMGGSGRLAAVEPVAKRFFTLRENVNRAGADQIVKLYQYDGRDIGRKTPERFDAVMLDAPCTSEARFVADDSNSWRYWGKRKLAESARKQKGLLRSAVDATKVGGRVLYATCSFAPEENEAVLQHTLRRLDDAVSIERIVLPIGNVQSGLTCWRDKEWNPQVGNAVRVLPNETMTGFFLALLRKHKPTFRKKTNRR